MSVYLQIHCYIISSRPVIGTEWPERRIVLVCLLNKSSFAEMPPCVCAATKGRCIFQPRSCHHCGRSPCTEEENLRETEHVEETGQKCGEVEAERQ